MKMNNIVVNGLSNCGNCKFIVRKLQEAKIPHMFVKCEDANDVCDFLEKLTNCYNYPIIDIITLGSFGDKLIKDHTIIHLASEHSNERKERRLDKHYTGIEVLTLDEMYEVILKYTN